MLRRKGDKIVLTIVLISIIMISTLGYTLKKYCKPTPVRDAIVGSIG